MSRVFISYAREDEPTAIRLYQDLKVVGAEPWMDKYDLIGGQGWRGTIRQAVRRSSHFIPLISKNSVSKRGYVQREMREAIDKLKDIPPDEIFLIPVRLDDTDSSFEDIQELHRVDLFPSYERGFDELRRALEQSGALASGQSANAKDTLDAGTFSSYRILFDRPAFQFPCIFEYALAEIQHAIDDTSAALVTGKLYSRNRNLVLETHPKDRLQNPADQSTIDSIRATLSALRRPIDALAQLLRIRTSGKERKISKSFHHMEFHLVDLIRGGLTPQALSDSLELMDKIDEMRNSILKQMNTLLLARGLKLLPYITLSSDQLVLSQKLEENGGQGSQRWDDFYLRMHRSISGHLAKQ
jgi:TIR domain-containing protein